MAMVPAGSVQEPASFQSVCLFQRERLFEVSKRVGSGI
jgi:hypothetical protein